MQDDKTSKEWIWYLLNEAQKGQQQRPKNIQNNTN